MGGADDGCERGERGEEGESVRERQEKQRGDEGGGRQVNAGSYGPFSLQTVQEERG